MTHKKHSCHNYKCWIPPYIIQPIRRLGPIPTDCNFLKGVALRYRNFDSDGGSEIFLGKGDIGIGTNRNEENYNWLTQPTTITSYPLKFTYNPIVNQLEEIIKPLTFPTPPPLTNPNGDFTYNLLVGTRTINMKDLDMFEIIVSNRQNDPPGSPDNIVTLHNLTLTTSVGVYNITNNGQPFMPVWKSQIIRKYLWPNDGSNPYQGFTFEGVFDIQGRFTSSEASKVEIQIGKCTTGLGDVDIILTD